GMREISRPMNSMAPPSERRLPASWCTRVVLPAPLGPIRAWISLGLTDKSTWSVASTPPKRLTNFLTHSVGVGASAPMRWRDGTAVAVDDITCALLHCLDRGA